MTKYPLKQLFLWTPSIGPSDRSCAHITSYGFPGKTISGVKTLCAAGANYIFYVDPETDCWLTPDGKLLPIIDTTLLSRPGAPELVQPFRAAGWTFIVSKDGNVQINTETEGNGYVVRMYKLDDLYVEGEAFDFEE